MRDDLVQEVIRRLRDTEMLYYRLVLLVLPSGGGKTGCLEEVGRKQGVPVVNVSLELSRSLLPLTERQRAFQLTRILEEFILAAGPLKALRAQLATTATPRCPPKSA